MTKTTAHTWLFKARFRRQAFGYDITSTDVRAAYASTMKAAERLGREVEVKARTRVLATSYGAQSDFVAQVLGRELGLR